MPIIKEDPLKKYDADVFDFKSMKGEVSEAIHYDWKRDKVDDAKKRAIHTARCYDDFKDRVATCTLKPIHRNEFNEAPKFSFNNRQDQSGTAKPAVALLGTQGSAGYNSDRATASQAPVFTEKVPKNGHEFDRELRRRKTAEDKVRLIELVLEKCDISRLFSRELDGEMLREVLTALDEVLERGTIVRGVARTFFVAISTECPTSITSACSFFDAEERGTIARILARDPATEAGEDVRVCAAFGIPPSSVVAAAAELGLADEMD